MSAPPPVDDPALLTCKTVTEEAPGVCGVLENAPRADVSNPAVIHTVEIWNRLEAPFQADVAARIARRRRLRVRGERQVLEPRARFIDDLCVIDRAGGGNNDRLGTVMAFEIRMDGRRIE